MIHLSRYQVLWYLRHRLNSSFFGTKVPHVTKLLLETHEKRWCGACINQSWWFVMQSVKTAADTRMVGFCLVAHIVKACHVRLVHKSASPTFNFSWRNQGSKHWSSFFEDWEREVTMYIKKPIDPHKSHATMNFALDIFFTHPSHACFDPLHACHTDSLGFWSVEVS